MLVSGKVQNFYPLGSGETVATTSNLSVTEITSPTVSTLSSGNTLPAPIVLNASTVQAVYAPDLGGGNIESTPVTPGRSVLDFYRSIEGMRVEIDDARVIGPSNSFGEQYVTVKPTEAATYRGGAELLGENEIPTGRLEVVADDGANPGVSVGDVFTGPTVGTIDYSRFGGFLVAASALGPCDAPSSPIVMPASVARKKSNSPATAFQFPASRAWRSQ